MYVLKALLLQLTASAKYSSVADKYINAGVALHSASAILQFTEPNSTASASSAINAASSAAAAATLAAAGLSTLLQKEEVEVVDYILKE